MDDLDQALRFLEGKMTKKEENFFWNQVASNREVRVLFYMALIEKWNRNELCSDHKDLAVKLYKISDEFHQLFDLLKNEEKSAKQASSFSQKVDKEF